VVPNQLVAPPCSVFCNEAPSTVIEFGAVVQEYVLLFPSTIPEIGNWNPELPPEGEFIKSRVPVKTLNLYGILSSLFSLSQITASVVTQGYNGYCLGP
jgi:hypothetical protein